MRIDVIKGSEKRCVFRVDVPNFIANGWEVKTKDFELNSEEKKVVDAAKATIAKKKKEK